MLIVSLPLNPNAEVDHLLCTTPQRIAHSARSRVSELARLATQSEVVGVIPWQCLSWIHLTLPKSALRRLESKSFWPSGAKHTLLAQGPKAQNLIQGLLEEQLLGEVSDIHWIGKTLDPSSAAAPVEPSFVSSGHPSNTITLQMAYCSKTWLRQALKTLESVELTPNQLVPEIEPQSGSGGPVLYALNSLDGLSFVLSTTNGVLGFPRSAMSGFTQLKDPSLKVFCEPSTIDQVSAMFLQSATLQTSHQRLLESSQSDWDFAAGEWDQGPTKKITRTLKSSLLSLWHAPHWSLARWALGMTLCVHILGLNVWAWHLKAAHQAALQSEAQILQTTFPKVQRVVDARLQMARELNALKQNLGEPSNGDFEHLLSVMRELHTSKMSSSPNTPMTPKTHEIQGIQFAHQTLKWHYNPNIALSTLELKLTAAMVSQGYQLKQSGTEMVLSWSDQP